MNEVGMVIGYMMLPFVGVSRIIRQISREKLLQNHHLMPGTNTSLMNPDGGGTLQFADGE